MKYFVSIFLLVIFFISCSEDSDVTGTNNNKITNHGNDSTDSYMPISLGSWWKYKRTSLGVTITYKNFINKEESKNGKLYSVIENDQNNEIGYSRIEGNNYLAILNIPGVTPEEVIQMKIKPTIDDNWYYDILNQGLYWRYSYEVIGIDKSWLVGNLSFENVTQVKLSWYYNPMYPDPDTWILTREYYYYYAKGIGLIELDGGEESNIKIIDYYIK